MWSSVGGKAGFLYFSDPYLYPRSSPHVSTQLADIYKTNLADFEDYWLQNYGPQDPGALLPLPKDLQHLHAAIESWSLMPLQPPLPVPPQPADNPAQRGPTPSQSVAQVQPAVQQQQQLIVRTQPSGTPAPQVLQAQQLNMKHALNNLELIRQNPELLKVSPEELKKLGWPEQRVSIRVFRVRSTY